MAEEMLVLGSGAEEKVVMAKFRPNIDLNLVKLIFGKHTKKIVFYMCALSVKKFPSC